MHTYRDDLVHPAITSVISRTCWTEDEIEIHTPSLGNRYSNTAMGCYQLRLCRDRLGPTAAKLTAFAICVEHASILFHR